MPVIRHPETGELLLSPEEAAELYGCSKANLRKLYQAGEIHRWEDSPRRVYYFPDEVKKLSLAKAEARKKRGGRPRNSESAA